MDIKKLELRMYGLVNYQLTGIQMGIQFGHAVVEYMINCPKKCEDDIVFAYNDWCENWKTFIILNGGTTNNNPHKIGTMNTHLQTLIDNEIFCASFYEPDLGDQLTSIVFIVDERVFNKEKYPDFDLKQFYGEERIKISEIYTDPMNPIFPNKSALIGKMVKLEWDKWVESIGGKKNLFLRLFLKNFRLA